jgi:hypothetical protein
MYAFLLNHFGNNKTYFKYELYFLLSFRDKTKHDIIYFYSINDTPKEYIDIIASLNLNIIFLPLNDDKVTFNIDFNSSYESFNLLRTCNYIFGFELLKYKKICTIETDMIIPESIDDIFELKCPSIVFYKLNNKNINKNIKINLNKIEKEDLLKVCEKESFTNGGVILFEPSIKYFKLLKKNIKIIIKNNCRFPSETLFLYTFPYFYNLPIKYNTSHFFVSIDKYKSKGQIKVLHFNNTEYKPIFIIEDKDFDITKMKNPIKKKLLLEYKEKYYNKYNKKINKLINKL